MIMRNGKNFDAVEVSNMDQDNCYSDFVTAPNRGTILAPFVRYTKNKFVLEIVRNSYQSLGYEKSFVANTWINKSRDWHIDGVANKSSVWFFMSTNLQKIPVKISWHSDVWSTSYSDLSDASRDILKTMDSKQFRVLFYHCFLMKKNIV